MNILGIHDGHTSSAALIRDGRFFGVVQEERYTRTKNQGGFPEHAIAEILDLAGLSWSNVDAAAFSTQTFRNDAMRDRTEVMAVFDDLFSGTCHAPIRKTRDDTPDASSPSKKATVRSDRLRAEGFAGPIEFIDHHTCHASAAYFARGQFDSGRCAVLTADGQGDGASGAVFVGEGCTLTEKCHIPRDDSIAQIYSYLTYLLGFVPLEHEYKLMGLAPYAAGSKGAREISQFFFSMFAQPSAGEYAWRRVDGVPPSELQAGFLFEKLKRRRFDELAAGLQIFFEEFVTEWALNVTRTLQTNELAVAGGAFMNVKLNQRLSQHPSIADFYVVPSCGDESNSLGAAWALSSKIDVPPEGGMRDIYCGRRYGPDEYERALNTLKSTDVFIVRPNDIEGTVAEHLAAGKIVARFAAGAEFGARALGNRSILSRPDSIENLQEINSAIKSRDFWMPFAPSILDVGANRLLSTKALPYSPHMMISFDTTNEGAKLLAAAIHPKDKTARAQILRQEDNESYYRLVECFHTLTGIPAVLNTSFNIHGEPIVETPEDAVSVFVRSELRTLALGPYLLTKSDRHGHPENLA
ncbi:carbamoyltransferase C-terminal domain-containing protein [Paraburkholderia caribensis]|uniref:Carbamoyltransferase C-terminal domain-containing protein n=1 Tax=Paraburkholderia caribensis TaxID=75105 RepID=A0ABV0E8Z1_9BURK|nr:carbamoyltransferase C-terminal domain-containing protein [Paraburkholderia caribensis]MCO4882710.1 carbamoyltransferase [Paraburkholderia caribensis]PTB23822.1 carbamoyltransferase [Paraburkholderia caribensis]